MIGGVLPDGIVAIGRTTAGSELRRPFLKKNEKSSALLLGRHDICSVVHNWMNKKIGKNQKK